MAGFFNDIIAKVVSITQTASGKVAIILSTDIPFAVDDSITISGATGVTGFNGVFKIAELTSSASQYVLSLNWSTLVGTYVANSASIYTNQDEYTRDHTIAIDCVELHLKDTLGADETLYLCSGGANLTFTSPTAPNGTSNTYTAQGDFIGFTSLTQDFDVKVGKFSVYLSGIGNGFISKLINYEIEGKRAVIYKAFLNFGVDGTSPLSIVADPLLMFDGVIYNFGVEEAEKSCRISIDISSLFADFERLNGRKSTNWSNWLLQGTKYDQAFNKSGYVGQTEFKWGRN